MKKIFVLIFLLVTVTVSGQQRPMQSMYMFDPLLINPAYAGSQAQISATTIYRNQWVNFPGAPKTFTATVHSGFRNSRVGLGLIAGRDEIGIHGENSLYLVYSYKIPISKYSKTSISFGLQGGFNALESDFLKLNPHDPDKFGVMRNMTWNFGTGLFLRGDKFYAGISVPYGLNNKVINSQDPTLEKSLARQRRYYYLTGGYTHKVSQVIKLIPSTLIRFQEQAPLSIDVNLLTVLYDAVGLGVSYRNIDAVVGLFELQINQNFHVGYAYDFTTSDIAKYSNGTHEIMINYRIKIPRLHKGVECPTYW